MFGRLNGVVLAAGLGLAVVPSAHAQDKNAFRTNSKAAAAQLRGFGEPKDRCSLGVIVDYGGIVVRTVGATELAAGDKLLTINGTDVTTRSINAITNILRAIAPTQTVAVTMERAGNKRDLQLTCTNSRPSVEALLAALDLAAAGKFDECLAMIHGPPPT